MKTPPEQSVASVNEAKDRLNPYLDSTNTPVSVIEANAKEIKELSLDAEFEKEALKRLVDDNHARKSYSQWLFAITVIWMFVVLIIVIQCGRRSLVLSDGVLIALITTTTANVFGFFYVVVNYLFNKDKST
jgi:hypothetical protein